MTSQRATNVGLLATVLIVAFFAVRAQHYCEHNYMRRKKNEKRIKRYGQRMCDHEKRIQEMEAWWNAYSDVKWDGRTE